MNKPTIKLVLSFLCFLNFNLYSQNEVQFLWSGALQPTSIKITAKLTHETTRARAVISPNPDFSSPRYYSPVVHVMRANNLVGSFEVSGLKPNTFYYYAVEDNGFIDNSPEDIHTFRTPTEGGYSFTFAVGSCNLSTNPPVFGAMADFNPLFFICPGDIQYDNPNSSNINDHRSQFENLLKKNNHYTQKLFSKTPIVYVWDDHDYCGDDSHGEEMLGAANARRAYQEYIPHYPLVEGEGNTPIYQSFTIGRVHFIALDTRSKRTATSMLGYRQKIWFKNEVLNAQKQGKLIAVISSVPPYGTSSDSWGGFAQERTELYNFLRDNNIKNLFFISGDAHMLGIDDGRNAKNYYSGESNPNHYPVIQAGAIYQVGSYKGGVYSHGWRANESDYSEGQFGIVRIKDDGIDSVKISLSGYWLKNDNPSVVNHWNTYTFSRRLEKTDNLTNVLTINNLKITISPNPTSDFLVISTEGGDFSDKNIRIQVSDILGRIVSNSAIDLSKKTLIDVRHLARGEYIFTLFKNNEVLKTGSFIKN